MEVQYCTLGKLQPIEAMKYKDKIQDSTIKYYRLLSTTKRDSLSVAITEFFLENLVKMSTLENPYIKFLHEALSKTNSVSLFHNWNKYSGVVEKDIDDIKSFLMKIGGAGNINKKTNKLNFIREKIQRSGQIVDSFKKVFGDLLKCELEATQECIERLGTLLESRITHINDSSRRVAVKKICSSNKSSLDFPILLFQESPNEIFLLYRNYMLDKEILPVPVSLSKDQALEISANMPKCLKGDIIDEEDSEDDSEEDSEEEKKEKFRNQFLGGNREERNREYARCQKWPPPPQPRKEHEIPYRPPEKGYKYESDFFPHITRLPTHHSKKITTVKSWITLQRVSYTIFQNRRAKVFCFFNKCEIKPTY